MCIKNVVHESKENQQKIWIINLNCTVGNAMNPFINKSRLLNVNIENYRNTISMINLSCYAMLGETVFKTVGKCQSHGHNLFRRLRDMLHSSISGFVFKISQICHPF